MKNRPPPDSSEYTKWLKQKANLQLTTADTRMRVPAYERHSIVSQIPSSLSLRRSELSLFQSTSLIEDFTPSLINGLYLWLDSDLTSMSFIGNRLTAWRDKSEVGNNLTAVGTGPLLVSTPNNPVGYDITFNINGTNQYIGANSVNSPGTQALSVFILVKNNGSSSSVGGRIISGITNGADNADPTCFRISNTGSIVNSVTITKGANEGTNYRNLLNQYHIINVQWNGSSPHQIYSDGSLIGTYSVNNASTNFSFNRLGLGAALGSSPDFTPGTFWSGSLNEVIIYRSVLTTTERQKVEGYLASKWGLRAYLPYTHPYGLPFTPTSIPGISLWLDASDSTTLTVSSEGKISQWKDKSGIGRDANQTTDNVRPVSQGGGVYFWQTQYLTLQNSKNILQYTGYAGAFIVAKVGQAQVRNTNRGGILNIPNGGNGSTRFALSLSNYSNFVNFPTPGVLGRKADGEINATVSGESASYNYNVGFLSFGEANYAGLTLKEYLNGTQSGTTTNFTTVITPNTDNTVSVNDPTINSSSTEARMTDTYVYEILVYTTAITDTQRQQVEGYLALKWGLQAYLPSTHPYAVAFTPTSIPGISLWLDASDYSTIGFNNSNVTEWRDKSGNRFNMSSNSSYQSPTYSANGFNGKPTISFSRTASNSFTILENRTFNFSSNSLTLFFITQRNGSATNYQRFFSAASSTVDLSKDNDNVGAFCVHSGTGNTGITYQRSTSYAIPNIITTTPFMGEMIVNASGSTIESFTNLTNYVYKNGLQVGSSLTPTAGSNFTIRQVRLGAATQTASTNDLNFEALQGNMSEVLLFNRVLTRDEFKKVEGYLAWKWGLQASLPLIHPYYSAKP